MLLFFLPDIERNIEEWEIEEETDPCNMEVIEDDGSFKEADEVVVVVDVDCRTALDNPQNEIFNTYLYKTSTLALWIVMCGSIGVLTASATEMWYDIGITVIRGTKYPEL